MLQDFGISEKRVAQRVRAPQWQYLRRDTGAAIVFDMTVLSDVTACLFWFQYK